MTVQIAQSVQSIDPADYQSWVEKVAENSDEFKIYAEREADKVQFVNPIQWPDAFDIDGITGHQRAQLSLAMHSSIGLFSGGPGTGKTHSIAHLIKAIQLKNKHAMIRLVAPTGKAAQRMSQAMREAKVDLKGSTIHTALVPTRNGHDKSGWGFQHNKNNPIYAHLIVVDESSMIDCGLMASLLSAVGKGTLVLFVGDPNQLPPVGKGRPFADMIEAGLPHGHLTEIHRFAGRIARVCQQIISMERWEPSPVLDLDSKDPENMRHVECANPAGLVSGLSDLLQRVSKRGFNLMNDVQVLCATNDTREKLNVALQKLLNPMGEGCDGNPYKIGDKAICLRNQWIDSDWDAPRKPKDNPQHYVANGDIGEVVRIDKTFTVVRFEDGRRLRFVKAAWSDISLAYAVTVWKGQGSQWPVIITVAEDSRGADMIADAAFWYTAISRAGKLSLTLGKRNAIDRQCSRAGIYHRKTLLVEKIRASGIVGRDSQDLGIDNDQCNNDSDQDDFSDI